MQQRADRYDEIINQLDFQKFKLPLIQKSTDYFPSFLKSKLLELFEYYSENLTGIFEVLGEDWKFVNRRVADLNNALFETVQYYYQGKIHEAYTCFESGLEAIQFNDVTAHFNIFTHETNSFYRGRINEKESQFQDRDLFHIPFEERYKVSTNRFSILGLPALYLSDSIYTCWAELCPNRLSDLSLSRFCNTKDLKVVQIQRLEDLCTLIARYPEFEEGEKLHFLKYFLLTFPVILSASIAVRENNGTFKPEYIIPQMLSQYVAKSSFLDGIKFISTKINYNRIENVHAYNYVFPVKHVFSKGFCSILTDTFHLTPPSSLHIEEMMNTLPHLELDISEVEKKSSIELVSGEKVVYSRTLFGRMESVLKRRLVRKLM